MRILPITFQNNNTNNINFGINYNFKPINANLSKQEVRQVRDLLETYTEINSKFSNINPYAKVKFKYFFPNLLESAQNISGFTFKTEDDSIFKGKLIQVFSRQNKKADDNFLTLGIYNNDGNVISRYRITRDGDTSATLVSDDKFCRKILKYAVEKFKDLKFYCDNYGKIKHDLKSGGNVIEKIKHTISAETATSMKDDIFKIINIYPKMIEKLPLRIKQVNAVKKEFFGNNIPIIRKNQFQIKDIEKNNKIYDYSVARSVKDKRLFKISELDENLNPTQTFVFFADGRVAIPKEDLKDVSYPKLKFLTEKEIQEYDLKHIFKFLQDNINGFKDFLVNKKLEKIDVRINKNMNVKQVQEENKLNRLKNKTLEQ